MQWCLHVLLSLLPLSGFAGNSPQCRAAKSELVYVLQDHYQNQSFLDEWIFFSGPDPTHGLVNYQTKEAAIEKKLAVVENGTIILAVDSSSKVPVGGSRDSVRMQSPKRYTHGLFIADIQAMPYGCAVWPAFWSVGPNWPNNGEIDVVEGANTQLTNEYTLHTSPNCSLPTASNHSVTGTLKSTSCFSSDDSGCVYSDTNSDSYGANFNKINGGVFAYMWNNDAITIWHFNRKSIPRDITKKKPKPSQWGHPAAYFPSTDCSLQSHFRNHTLVLDIALCGDFAGSTYSASGCPGTCPQTVADPANFQNAKWKINYISVYRKKTLHHIDNLTFL